MQTQMLPESGPPGAQRSRRVGAVRMSPRARPRQEHGHGQRRGERVESGIPAAGNGKQRMSSEVFNRGNGNRACWWWRTILL